MLLSVLIPTLNRYDKLVRSIKSWGDSDRFEFLVRFHCSDVESFKRWQSDEDTFSIERSARWNVIMGQDKLVGQSNSFLWNELLPLAKGEWIQFWSDDMIIEGDWITPLEKAMGLVVHPEYHQLNQSVYHRDPRGPTPFVRRAFVKAFMPEGLTDVPDKFFGGMACDFLAGVKTVHHREIDSTLPAHEY